MRNPRLSSLGCALEADDASPPASSEGGGAGTLINLGGGGGGGKRIHSSPKALAGTAKWRAFALPFISAGISCLVCSGDRRSSI